MIKEILVHLDGSDDDESRILHADHLAIVYQAHVQGLYINILPEPPESISHYAVSRSLLSQHLDDAKTQCRLVEHALEERLGKLAGPHDLHRIDCRAANVQGLVATQARTADLLVVRTPYRIAEPNRASDVVEAALFGSGRGVFVIPEEDPLRLRPFDTVLVAWKDSREAANAVAQAMPFLRRASQVIIATIDNGGPKDAPGDRNLARYLERHGVAAEIRRLGKWDNIAAGLFNEAELSGAGLMVAGAYGHSRLREWALGGVTRDILTKTPVPALLAH
ncbi:UspA-like protein [Nitrospirillum viridazoti Y2]|uniref:Universal stress protein family protein n=1 Tax=Nitrospirillum amazonense TaxID=28077 RepID=A0A560IYP0_9PROT|nr:universal stress protein [Nitrospirillum amazonense]EGY01678.1 UspA-like protein [Nitrospirillum amazonense Y2]TWB63957.1 universal stress protein family protein [Nitrospirillum amazonense]